MVKLMKTIKENITNEIIIKNSRFINKLIKITDSSEVDTIILSLKKSYPDASHYCYAYIVKGKMKSTDDKEPSSTAGLPMLNVLLKNDLTNILAVTIRYFGGIKLGAGGLTRAYSKSVTASLEKATLVELIPAYIIELTTNYDNQKKLDYQLKDEEIIKKEYLDNIKYTVCIAKTSYENYKMYNPQIILETYKEKNLKTS